MMIQNVEREILAILRRNDPLFAVKLLTRAVNLEKTIHKRAANAPTVQSEALTATKTAESGRYGDYTTAAARNQEGRNGNE